MPLVVPGIMTGSGDKTEEWTNKLVGKKLSEDQSNEVVSAPSLVDTSEKSIHADIFKL
jgi:hypothetical protein